MAYSIIPSARWQEILDMTDESEQGIAATKYVYQLEKEIEHLKVMNKHCRDEAVMEVVGELMKNKSFKDWLQNHDDEIYETERQDWSGVK